MATNLRRAAVSLLPPHIVGLIRERLLRRRLSRYPMREVRHLYGGIPLTLSIADDMAEGWYDCDWPMLPEVQLLRGHRLRPGARVLDLGAHHGVVALMMTGIVGERGHIVAVEANPHNAATAERNRVLNQASQITIVQAAVAAAPGSLFFSHSLNGQVDDGRGLFGRQRVVATTVDELAVTHGAPDVVFMDVEGFEADVLRGARSTIANRPDWFVEVHVDRLRQFGGSADQVVAAFGQGYQLLAAPDHPPFAYEFGPYDGASVSGQDRFFLIALGASTQV